MHDSFLSRHLGVSDSQQHEMVSSIGKSSLDHLIQDTIPQSIQTNDLGSLDNPLSETQALALLQERAQENKLFKSFIGQGFYPCITPTPIKRLVLENPAWYTQYTPYQAEISQGRLEALLNFQTMICELTGLPIANASLLDEATAAAEALTLMVRSSKVTTDSPTIVISEHIYDHIKPVLQTRATCLGCSIQWVDSLTDYQWSGHEIGVLLAIPDARGCIQDLRSAVPESTQAMIGVIADVMALTLITPPGELGADIVVGSTQRFGIPMGYGGPHAAFFATKSDYSRKVPGRIIGVSIDKSGNTAYRMALQTREQHIRKDKATSNICTAQALLAIMAGFYAVYHGPNKIKSIATTIHQLTHSLAESLQKLGYTTNSTFFDTLTISNLSDDQIKTILTSAETNNYLLYHSPNRSEIRLSIDELTTADDIDQLLSCFEPLSATTSPDCLIGIPTECTRSTSFMTQPVFNQHHSETQLMRYIHHLESKDLSLVHSMIPLGSCTMKLNSATSLQALSWPEFSSIHPFTPLEHVHGYQRIISELESNLATITGFDATSLQPNSGAQGELAGLLVIKHYFESRNEQRDIVLVPTSAHGTNPASAVAAGLRVVSVKCLANGRIDHDDFNDKLSKYSDSIAALMVTYPSTFGVFDADIQDICQAIHDIGGQVYMDGANMNAQVGLTHPGKIGADVCHLNLHKTFSIPHGGGGPGVGPICVAKHLTPFLPSHPFLNPETTFSIAAAPWGSASISLISYTYIKMLGKQGLKKASEIAILNANYIKSQLEDDYSILFTGDQDLVAHELIIDCRPFKKSAQIDVEDIAKRLMDYGFHAPTVSWPVPGTMMIEPTESESKEELDLFCTALKQIRSEIKAIEQGVSDTSNNPLKNAPHPLSVVTNDEWEFPYSRDIAAYPLPHLRHRKCWPTVERINQAHGDRQLVCQCPSVEELAI